MLDELVTAVRSRLMTDPDLSGYLVAYGDEPAVFWVDDDEVVPQDVGWPYATVALGGTPAPDDTMDREGREVPVDIGIWARRSGSTREQSNQADRIIELFHRQPLEVEGWEVWNVQARGPVPSGAPGTIGYVVTVTVSLQKEEQ